MHDGYRMLPNAKRDFLEDGTTGYYPERTHYYQNHHLDSTRWDGFLPRNDDIIIATPYKSGTTWMQAIVGRLILNMEDDPISASPWLDTNYYPLKEVMDRLIAQKHRRFLKTHLPLDGLIYFPAAKYIVVGRDVRDVFMSLWNHYSNYTRESFERRNNALNRHGSLMPDCPNDVREFWKMWITRGWFDWENEGYPFWSNMRHVQTWWNFRHLPNILFVHFNDLKVEPEVQIRRIAQYLDIPLEDGDLPAVVYDTSFDVMRSEAIAREEKDRGPKGLSQIFRGGARTFFHRGSNGRWRGVLTSSDLELYNEAARRELSLDCRAWLEGTSPPT
jgi:aryl sulfotransferase